VTFFDSLSGIKYKKLSVKQKSGIYIPLFYCQLTLSSRYFFKQRNRNLPIKRSIKNTEKPFKYKLLQYKHPKKMDVRKLALQLKNIGIPKLNITISSNWHNSCLLKPKQYS